MGQGAYGTGGRFWKEGGIKAAIRCRVLSFNLLLSFK